MGRTLKFRLSDPTFVSDVNQTLSGLFPIVHPKSTIASYKGVSVIGGSSSTPKGNVAVLPSPMQFVSASTSSLNAVTYMQCVQASAIVNRPTKSTITLQTALNNVTISNCQVVRTLPGSLVPVDSMPITFGGTNSPTFATAGFQTSDVIEVQIDTAHDYWFQFYAVAQSPTQGLSVWPASYVTGTFGGPVTGGSGRVSPFFNDYTYNAALSPSNNPIPPLNGSGACLWLFQWASIE